MDHDELLEAIMKVTGPRAAIAALVLVGDHKGARQRAEQMSPDDLLSLVLLSAHEHAFGYVEAIEQQLKLHGRTPEQASQEARETALISLRATARMTAGFGPQASGEADCGDPGTT
jgi:hypothetical protein